jgi:coproporphyrinogen III oxidase-like Fe-S oxidoreductase
VRTFREFLAAGGLFQGYAYAYPHKTSYRALQPPVSLSEAWRDEDKSSLFLYAHVPFCSMRCGFCNLFTMTHPGEDRVSRYLKALERQAMAVSEALGDWSRFSRVALGGGTPTFLHANELAALFGILHRSFRIQRGSPTAVELSPATATLDRLSVLRDYGTTRVSLGVQSFVEAETRALGRAQPPPELRSALERLRNANFPVLNIDLIYGAEGQTRESWLHSLSSALEFSPEEIYLYPLYVRPLTGLGRNGTEPDDERIGLYLNGRDFLREKGYRQISMRLFRAANYSPPPGPDYCCQDDGMVGLGPGARSYTTNLHYSSEWAVGAGSIRGIVDDYVLRTSEQMSYADYGCKLDLNEQRRRYLIKSLLRVDGLEISAYAERFGSNVLEDFPGLEELAENGALLIGESVLSLTDLGLQWSDAIGPWLFSTSMRSRMETFALA